MPAHLSLMLQEGSCQLKSIKDTIDPKESSQYLLISYLSVQTKDINGIEDGVCVWRRNMPFKMQLIFLRIIFSYKFVITRSVLRSEVLDVLRFPQSKKINMSLCYQRRILGFDYQTVFLKNNNSCLM